MTRKGAKEKIECVAIAEQTFHFPFKNRKLFASKFLTSIMKFFLHFFNQ